MILSRAKSQFEYYDFGLAMAAIMAAARCALVAVAIRPDHSLGESTGFQISSICFMFRIRLRESEVHA